jgi:cation diffusion facilitator family transporter
MLPLKNSTSRANTGFLGGWLSIALNVSLFLVKAIIGFSIGSVALVADAFHTLSDIGTSIIVLYTFHVSEKPSDAKHPFGHGRAEFISAIVIGTLLAVTAVELFKYSLERTLQGDLVDNRCYLHNDYT